MTSLMDPEPDPPGTPTSVARQTGHPMELWSSRHIVGWVAPPDIVLFPKITVPSPVIPHALVAREQHWTDGRVRYPPAVGGLIPFSNACMTPLE